MEQPNLAYPPLRQEDVKKWCLALLQVRIGILHWNEGSANLNFLIWTVSCFFIFVLFSIFQGEEEEEGDKGGTQEEGKSGAAHQRKNQNHHQTVTVVKVSQNKFYCEWDGFFLGLILQFWPDRCDSVQEFPSRYISHLSVYSCRKSACQILILHSIPLMLFFSFNCSICEEDRQET